LPVKVITHHGFVDMSGGSNDDACLGIAHRDRDNRVLLDRIVDQGQRPPFDPRNAVERFANVLKEYGLHSGNAGHYAGETVQQDFQQKGIAYRVSELTKSEIYEELEPLLNGGRVVLLDQPTLRASFSGWSGGRARSIIRPASTTIMRTARREPFIWRARMRYSMRARFQWESAVASAASWLSLIAVS